MRRSFTLRCAKIPLFLSLALATGSAAADAPPPPPIVPAPAPGAPGSTTTATPGRSDVVVEMTPLFGQGSPVPPGWSGFVVRVRNNGQKPLRGEVQVESKQYADHGTFRASAPFAVPPATAVSVRLPVYAVAFGDVTVTAVDDTGLVLQSLRTSVTAQQSILLVDANDGSRVRGAVHEVSIYPQFQPWGGVPAYGAGPQLLVGAPRTDPDTGDPILPDRAAMYAPAAAVLMRSDTLARLGAAELDALSSWVLSGGTLAVAVVRPEDIRNPALVAFAGGDIVTAAPHSETLRELRLPAAPAGAAKTLSPAESPSEDVRKTLTGFSGGNLHGSPYGASSYYGLGEVHLLGFDPTRKPGVDDPWVQIRLVDLSRRAFDRKSTLVYPQGGANAGPPEPAKVRQELDPNEGSRWAIAAAALLLCVYSVLAAPVNFTMHANRGKPLRALLWLPILSAITFFVIVLIGVAAKGVSGRSRHLSLVEAGAGMPRGAVRRWRGFFMAQSRDLTVRTSDGTSVAATAVVAQPAERNDHMIVDRDGARLVDVAALPWQTVVIREDGVASLGEGISVLKEGEKDIAVTNRSGRSMRGVIVVLPSGAEARYFPRVKDGERVLASAGQDVDKLTNGSAWLRQIASAGRAGAIDIHPLASYYLAPMLEADAPGLGHAWWAIEESAGGLSDWFPPGVPVVLGQLDGGEGRTSDAGLKLERDRMLVRIVGYGGRP